MRAAGSARTVAGCSPPPLLATLAVLLISTPAAHAAAKTVSVPVPTEGQVTVVVASGAKAVSVKAMPNGLTVAGGVKAGKLAVAVIRPRGVAASGKVALTVKGRPQAVKTFAAALDGGKAGAACKDLGALLTKRLKGTADAKALAPVLAAKLCGKAAPANANDVLAGLALGAAPAPPAPPAVPPAKPGARRRLPTVTPTKKACENGIDNDADGQTDLEDPGCDDVADGTENSEVPVSAECLANSGFGMGDDPKGIGLGINSGCGQFLSLEIIVEPGIIVCDVFTEPDNSFNCTVDDGVATAATRKAKATDLADLNLTLTGNAVCNQPAMVVFYRPSGEVGELVGSIHNCHGGGAPQAQCANGIDDDGDGRVDAREKTGVTNPDPGCNGAADTSENSEIAIPAACDVQLFFLDDNLRLPAMSWTGCGSIKGAWLKPTVTRGGCALPDPGLGRAQNCTVTGATGGASFAATANAGALVTPIASDALCGTATVALIRADDQVMADTVDWC